VSKEDYPRLKSIEKLLEKEIPREALPEGIIPPNPESLNYKQNYKGNKLKNNRKRFPKNKSKVRHKNVKVNQNKH
jgi:hypothetical protein